MKGAVLGEHLSGVPNSGKPPHGVSNLALVAGNGDLGI
jgi:hypothetical protein